MITVVNTSSVLSLQVVASLARPVCKSHLARQRTKGGYKVNNITTVESTSPPEQQKTQEDAVIEMKDAPCQLSKGNKRKRTCQGLTQTQKSSQKYKGKRQARGSSRPFVNGRPAKKERRICMSETVIFIGYSMEEQYFDTYRCAGDVPKSSERRRFSDSGSPRGIEHAQALSYSCGSGSHTYSNDLVLV